MTEKWVAPLPKKRAEERTDDSIRPHKTSGLEGEGLPELPVVDDRLAGDPHYDIPRLEQYLRETRFLDPSLAVHEHLQSRDPMLIVLEAPGKTVILGDGTESTVIDELIKSGHNAFHRSCGSRYMDFGMIQYAVQATLASKDIQAKQFMFLCMLAFDQGLQDTFLASYPPQVGEIRESDRFEPFMKTVKTWLDEVLNTMYVNVPAPTRYNVDDLLRKFLTKCITRYQG